MPRSIASVAVTSSTSNRSGRSSVVCARRSPLRSIRYLDLVLEAADYPDGFPHSWNLSFSAESRMLEVDYDLPSVDVVPPVRSYRYVRSTDAIAETARPATHVQGALRECDRANRTSSCPRAARSRPRRARRRGGVELLTRPPTTLRPVAPPGSASLPWPPRAETFLTSTWPRWTPQHVCVISTLGSAKTRPSSLRSNPSSCRELFKVPEPEPSTAESPRVVRQRQPEGR